MCVTSIALCQKPSIDSLAYRNWTVVKNPYLTSDAKYLKYSLINEEFHTSSTIIQAVNSDWKLEFSDGDILFLGNDRYLLHGKGDTMDIFTLGSGAVKSFNTRYYSCPKVTGMGLIFFQDSLNIKSLKIVYLNDKISVKTIQNVGAIQDYCYLSTNNSFVAKVNEGNKILLKYIDLNNGNALVIDSGDSLETYTLTRDSSKLIYLKRNSRNGNDIFSFSFKDKKRKKLLSDDEFDGDREFVYIEPTQNADRILITLSKTGTSELLSKQTSAEVSIWAYNGDLPVGNGVVTYGTAEHSDRKRILFDLTSEDVIDAERIAEETQPIANKTELDSIKKIGIPSPDNAFWIYTANNAYWSYEVSTGVTRNICEGVKNEWFSLENNDYDFLMPRGRIIAWASNEKSILVSDEYDLWKLSLDNKSSPINLTKGYGRKNKYNFFLIMDDDPRTQRPIISTDKWALFSVFDTKTKRNGFFSKKNLNNGSQLDSLIMEDAMFWHPYPPHSFSGVSISDYKPQKAKHSDYFLVAKSTAKESQNFYLTRDFRNFKQITNNFPERKYNWLTTELLTWRDLSGNVLNGILYKPENFDSTKKYPVIFYYYRKISVGLNAFIEPKQCPGCMIDIPTYVSNGYLVVTPDIYFTKGEPGKNALDAVVSVAKYISKRPYVDSTKLGIQGCSFSGFTTNYIVTHSNVFAAACSASGLFDFISGYNSINGGEIKQWQFENGPYQIGNTLWENPESYIENSAVFNADKITTPFLMMHTTKDELVPIANAFEFFFAARRLKKKVWLLQYGNNRNHVVVGNEGVDFNVRMRQFFDYYLKGIYPPKWMTKGSDNGLRHTPDKFELDSSGVIP